jgi:putative SOS response-associated peptidase YedK
MMFLGLIPNWLKMAVGGVIAMIIIVGASFALGKREGKNELRADIEVRAAKEALKRIDNLEKNNASFRNLDSHHRCLVFARDSGLPDTTCDD